MDLTESSCRIFKGRADRGIISDIAHDCLVSARMLVAQMACQGFQACECAPHQRDVCTQGGQLLRNGHPDASAGTGHNRMFALEICVAHCMPLLILRSSCCLPVKYCGGQYCSS